MMYRMIVVLLGVVLMVGSIDASPIVDAVRQGRINDVQGILNQNSKLVNERGADGATPLHWAAFTNDPQMAQMLLQAGAQVNAATTNGSSALHWAAFKDSDAIVNLLISRGVRVNAKTAAGLTPLHWAAIGNSARSIRVLVGSGAEVGARSKDGSTPLHVAVRKDALDAMAALVQAGASVYSKADDGTTPLYCVKSKRAREILEKALSEAAGKTGVAAGTTQRVTTAVAPAPTAVASIVPPVSPRNSGVVRLDEEPTRAGGDTLVYPNGDRYVGDCNNGHREGEGIYRFAGGDRYEGQWTDDAMTGQGRFVFKRGGELAGLWENGHLLDGDGMFIFRDGDRYEGSWRNDMMSGVGTYTTRAGTVFKGEFKANHFVGGTAASPDQGTVNPAKEAPVKIASEKAASVKVLPSGPVGGTRSQAPAVITPAAADRSDGDESATDQRDAKSAEAFNSMIKVGF